MSIIYTDNNATTQVAPEVLEVMKPYFTESYFNPSSMYEPARKPAKIITESREKIAGLLNCTDPAEILFTSCATESNNTAIYGAVKANPARKKIITSAVEHPAVLEVCQDLARNGFQVVFVPVDSQGRLLKDDFVRALDSDTLLVSIMHANNETGVIFPVEDLSLITKEVDDKILFHTDATQSTGKLPIDLRGNFKHVDMLSFSGHKLHAPKGIGALYLKKGSACRPLLVGGHQEQGRRAGTENVPYIAGLAAALDLALQSRSDTEARIKALRDNLQNELESKIPAVCVNGGEAKRLVNTLNISCHYVEGEGMLYQLSAQGICASSGSACTSGSLEPSHVLRAMQIPFTAIHGSIRFSLSRYNTQEDIDTICDVFPEVVLNLRRISPYWDMKRNAPREDVSI